MSRPADCYTAGAMTIRKPTTREVTRKRAPHKAKREMNIFDKIIELGRTIPPDERANFPTDGARNLDHYLYGSPKQD